MSSAVALFQRALPCQIRSIAITGLTSAGKTTLFQQILGRPPDITLETLGVEAEKWETGQHSVQLFDLGGSKPFQDMLWQPYIQQAQGIIFVVDGTEPTKFTEAAVALKQVIQWAELHSPIFILWNKADLPEFIRYAEAHQSFGLQSIATTRPGPICVFEGSALHNLNVVRGLNWFLEILHNYIMNKPVRFQALRVCSRDPQMVLAEAGYTNLFERSLEFCNSIFQHSYLDLKLFHLLGGNYALSLSSQNNYCIAIFANETPLELGNQFAALALQELEACLLEKNLPFPNQEVITLWQAKVVGHLHPFLL
ncbi:MAG: ADP-ribosylation factor-like protein [Candidatus Hodarchaeota archaeon]